MMSLANRGISDAEFRLFQQLFMRIIGLHLSDQKKMLVSGRLSKRVHALGLPGFREYHELINQPGQADELQQAIDLITTNETFFFREKKHFELLSQTILPARKPGQPFRVWSAASSTGEEPYSIAMVLHDAMGDNNWELIATDISERVLCSARRGLYKTDRISGIPAEFLKRYCLRGTGQYDGMLLVDKALRQRVEFRQVNLMAIPADLRQFDVIFLRNVIIYFDGPTKQRVVNEVASRLRPGGWLFLGHSESLAGMSVGVQQISPSVYRRDAER